MFFLKFKEGEWLIDVIIISVIGIIVIITVIYNIKRIKNNKGCGYCNCKVSNKCDKKNNSTNNS
jgi:hypothetical protein